MTTLTLTTIFTAILIVSVAALIVAFIALHLDKSQPAKARYQYEGHERPTMTRKHGGL